MRKIKKIFKFLSYSLLFLLITLGSAYGVITVSMNNAANKGRTSGSAEGSIPEQIQNMMNEMMMSSYITAQFDINISSPEQEIYIDISNTNIDLSEGLNNVSIYSDINIDMLSVNNKFDVSVLYSGGEIFVEGFNNKFKLETKNLISSITELSTMFNIELPDIASFDMGTFKFFYFFIDWF